MFHNLVVTVNRSQKAVTNTGAITETELTLATGVPAKIQNHTITSLPPPAQFHRPEGIVYVREHRCWIQMSYLPDVRVNDYIIDPTGRKYRVTAAIDDGGVGHHWLLRMVDYA